MVDNRDMNKAQRETLISIQATHVVYDVSVEDDGTVIVDASHYTQGDEQIVVGIDGSPTFYSRNG